MKRIVLALLLASFLATVPTGVASAATHPALSLAKGRQLIQHYSQRTIAASGGGFASVGRCGRVSAWKIDCVSTLTATSQSRCVMIVSVWNSAVVNGYFGRRYSYRGLACVPAPVATTPVAPPTPASPAFPPPAVGPTSIPSELVRSVADAYVGGIMRNAYSTTGGVDYCNYPVGFSGSCSYSFSGNRIADGSYYRCTGSLTIRGTYDDTTGWQTAVDYGSGPQCY
jgi:hypothetical protein